MKKDGLDLASIISSEAFKQYVFQSCLVDIVKWGSNVLEINDCQKDQNANTCILIILTVIYNKIDNSICNTTDRGVYFTNLLSNN